MNTKQRVSAQRGEHLAVLAVNEPAAIEFRCASLRRKIVTNNFGIREMSANVTPALGSICSSPFSPLRAGDGCRLGLPRVRSAASKPLGDASYDVLTNSLFDSRVHKTYGGKIVDEQYSPAGLAVPLAIKDLRLARAEAERAAVPMPAATLVHDRHVGMAARGSNGLDWSAFGLLAAVDAGLNDGR